VASASTPYTQLQRTYRRSDPALSVSKVDHRDLGARQSRRARSAVDLGGAFAGMGGCGTAHMKKSVIAESQSIAE
jgi:hypothetical protein